MDFNQVEHNYTVGGQIQESDLATIAGAGFKTVICNRPDSEIEPALHVQFMEAEALRLGLNFVYNPISGQGMTQENLQVQASVLAGTNDPVYAYCRSGMRSTTAWALIKAKELPVDEVVACAAGAGYNLDKMRPIIEAMAAA